MVNLVAFRANCCSEDALDHLLQLVVCGRNRFFGHDQFPVPGPVLLRDARHAQALSPRKMLLLKSGASGLSHVGCPSSHFRF